jgi:hypothetical protein
MGQLQDCITKQFSYLNVRRIKMQYEKLDIVNLVVVIGLVIALITAIFYGNAELSTTISAGLLGYLGGLVRVNNKDITK